MTNVANIVNVARREFTVRVRTRSFIFGTLLLAVGVVVIAFLPLIIRYVDRTNSEEVGVYVSAEGLAPDPVATLSVSLNATGPTGQPGTQPPDYVVTRVPDLAVARTAATAGDLAAVLAIERATDGTLHFTLYTNDNAAGPTAGLIRQASNAIVIGDRLARSGIAPANQAALFAPADFGVQWTDPARTDPTKDVTAMVGQDMLSFGMTVLIYLMIVMYGTWVAMSVVEEKTSRVMEVVLNAASSFQLLAGKVLGVGAVAFSQYAAIIVAGGLALVLQGPVASAVLGPDGTSSALPEGLTLGLLVLFGVYGVLGFLIYAALYAAAGALVSRQEDVNSAVMPMTLVSLAGYLIGIYASIGLLDNRAGWVTVLSQIPLVSPFMMLGRITTGVASPWEVVLSIGLLVLFLGGALWVAARIYAAGVLMYGQRPGARAIWRLVRAGA